MVQSLSLEYGDISVEDAQLSDHYLLALDQYAPISMRKTSVLKRKPYKYDVAIAEAKRLRRKYATPYLSFSFF